MVRPRIEMMEERRSEHRPHRNREHGHGENDGGVQTHAQHALVRQTHVDGLIRRGPFFAGGRGGGAVRVLTHVHVRDTGHIRAKGECAAGQPTWRLKCAHRGRRLRTGKPDFQAAKDEPHDQCQ